MEKVIFHIDVEQRLFKLVLSEGSGGGGRRRTTAPFPVWWAATRASAMGVVLAKSLPAKKYGIHTGESLFEARRKCPVLTILKTRISRPM